MILALNVNAAVDRVIFIDHFRSGETMRSQREVVSVGGKGLDIAQVMVALGAPVKALSFIAGDNGRLLERLLTQRGIPVQLIWVEGETRVAYVIVETDANCHSHITLSGYSITDADCRQYLEQVDHMAGGACWALMAGSLPEGAPQDFYRQVTDLLHSRGVKTLIDCAGVAGYKALSASPEIFKMNQGEFLETFGMTPQSDVEWQAVYYRLCAEFGIGSLVITLGADGILALTPEGRFHAKGPILKEVNAAGSGDAASAALVHRLSTGESWPDALRWAVAASAAVVLTEGTADCRLEDVAWLLPQAQVIRLEPV